MKLKGFHASAAGVACLPQSNRVRLRDYADNTASNGGIGYADRLLEGNTQVVGESGKGLTGRGWGLETRGLGDGDWGGGWG